MQTALLITLALCCLAGSTVSQEDSYEWVDSITAVPLAVLNTMIRSFVALGQSNSGDSIPLRNFTHNPINQNGFYGGHSYTYNNRLQGFSSATKSVTLNTTSNEVSMNIRFPTANFTGIYDMNMYIQFCASPWGCPFEIPSSVKGNGSFTSVFNEVEFGLSYTLSEKKGRVRTEKVHASLDFSNCTLYGDNFEVNDRVFNESDFETLGLQIKQALVENNLLFVAYLEESFPWFLNTNWALRRFTMEQVIDDLVTREGAVIIE